MDAFLQHPLTAIQGDRECGIGVLDMWLNRMHSNLSYIKRRVGGGFQMFREKWTTLLILVLVTLISMILVSEIVAQAPQTPPSKSLVAIDHAARANKYALIYFYRQDDPQT